MPVPCHVANIPRRTLQASPVACSALMTALWHCSFWRPCSVADLRLCSARDRVSALAQGFVADTAELPPGVTGKRYNSRIRVAQAHGIPAAALGKSRASAKSRDASVRSGADCTHTSGASASLMCFLTWPIVSTPHIPSLTWYAFRRSHIGQAEPACVLSRRRLEVLQQHQRALRAQCSS